MTEYNYYNLRDKNIIPDDCEKFNCYNCKLYKLFSLDK